jgi:hypothetical protein
LTEAVDPSIGAVREALRTGGEEGITAKIFFLFVVIKKLRMHRTASMPQIQVAMPFKITLLKWKCLNDNEQLDAPKTAE